MMLEEFKASRNTTGLMNINDSQNITCRGPEAHHLRNCQAHWDRCLANFKNMPDDETLQPLYDKQIKRNTAFEQTYELYEMSLTTESLERDCHKMYSMVKQVLELNCRIKRDRQASGEEASWSMAAYETAVTKLRPGDCKTKFWKDDVTDPIVHGSTPMFCLPTSEDQKVKAERKGNGKVKDDGKAKAEVRANGKVMVKVNSKRTAKKRQKAKERERKVEKENGRGKARHVPVTFVENHCILPQIVI